MRFLSLATMFVLSLGLSSGWAEDGGPSPPERDRYLLLDSRVGNSSIQIQIEIQDATVYSFSFAE
jgi:hypothetical protein